MIEHCNLMMLVMQVTHGSTMFLYNMDFAMEWPRPLPPNVQLVGALLPTEAKPLPAKFQVLFSSAIFGQYYLHAQTLDAHHTGVDS